jgi:hypothetical protein
MSFSYKWIKPSLANDIIKPSDVEAFPREFLHLHVVHRQVMFILKILMLNFVAVYKCWCST